MELKENNTYFEIDSANRLSRINYAFNAYMKIAWQAFISGVPILDLIRTQFPFILPDSKLPNSLTIDFTNHCNIKCIYCANPKATWEKGYMDDVVFSKLLNNIKQYKIKRARIVGYGESTIHPNFKNYTKELAQNLKFLSLVTNGQWKDDTITQAILHAPVDLIELSVDAGGKEAYEASKIGASFERLKHNLRTLINERNKMRSKSIINIRLNLRPSQKLNEKKFLGYWKKYSDIVMPQYLLKYTNDLENNDLYTSKYFTNTSYPKCNRIFKDLVISWNGDVPLCSETVNNPTKNFIISNIKKDNIESIWNNLTAKSYRMGHRYRKISLIPLCRGCRGF